MPNSLSSMTDYSAYLFEKALVEAKKYVVFGMERPPVAHKKHNNALKKQKQRENLTPEVEGSRKPPLFHPF